MNDFLWKVVLPIHPPEISERLEDPITLEVVHHALLGMKKAKSPGLNGTPQERFWSQLSPLQLNMQEASFTKSLF